MLKLVEIEKREKERDFHELEKEGHHFKNKTKRWWWRLDILLYGKKARKQGSNRGKFMFLNIGDFDSLLDDEFKP